MDGCNPKVMELLKFCIVLMLHSFQEAWFIIFFICQLSKLIEFQEFDNLDSLMSALVQIGFEHEDCRLAIQNGKLTADEIIDWYAFFTTSWIIAVYKSVSLYMQLHYITSVFVKSFPLYTCNLAFS